MYLDAAPNPELTQQMTPILLAPFVRQWGLSDVSVSCSGRACRITLPQAWALQHPGAIRAVFKEPALRGRVVAGTVVTGDAVAYVGLMPPGWRSGAQWLGELLDQRADHQLEAAVERCRPDAKVRGTVGVELSVTTSGFGGGSAASDAIQLDQTGELAGTSGADCVLSAYRELVRGVEVPDRLFAGSVEREYIWK